MPILGEEDFDSIRLAISTDLTEDDLPDTTIALPIYLGAAERWAKSVDPSIDTRTDDKLEAAQNAVALKTASLLIVALPILQREEFALGEGYTRQKVDTDQVSKSLAARAQAELDSYLNAGSTTTATYLPAFTVAAGNRGQ